MRPRPEPPAVARDRRTFSAFAIAAPGLAPLVAAELESLGVQPAAVEPAGVAFDASAGTLFRVNCWSRLATRIVVRLDRFEARDFATLEKKARRVPWDTVIGAGDAVALSVTCRKSRLYHSDAVAERIAGAIERVVPGARVGTGSDDDGDEASDATDATDDVGRDVAEDVATNVGGSVTSEAPRVQRILVRFDRDVCTISADSSGELLHRRGWRLDSGKAPLRETLAAALLTASGWTPGTPLVDPLCGAGTIAIEGALRARNIAPGLARGFACERWPAADPDIARTVREAAQEAVRPDTGALVLAADRDAGAIEATRTNAERAGVLGDLDLRHQPLSALSLGTLGPEGWVVTNPPYGIRTGDPATLRALWGRLGALLRGGGPGWTLGVVVPDRALARELRIPLDRVVSTNTGGRPIILARSRLPDRSP